MKHLVAVCVMAGGCGFDVSGNALPGDDETAVPDASPAAPDAAPATPDAGKVVEVIDIPGGAFDMGCSNLSAHSCDADELPSHAVSLSAYSIDQTEVTQAQYFQCVFDGACQTPHCGFDPEFKFDHPVVCVTWQQAVDYCEWAGKRLPTEAEWEYAARGDDGRVYPWGDVIDSDCTRANGDACAHTTRPVGSYPAGASPFGVLDMAGNVFEWVSDYYDADYYAQSIGANDPKGPEGWRESRSARGGSFLWEAHHYRTTNRSRDEPLDYFADLGFRCAR